MKIITEIRKRDGRIEPFDAGKIVNAIQKAMSRTGEVDNSVALSIASSISLCSSNAPVDVEEIQDMVEEGLMDSSCKNTAREYIKYREQRNQERLRNNDLNRQIEDILLCKNTKNQNANVDEKSFGGRKFESANVLHKSIALDVFIRPEVAQAHRESRIYIHDLSEYDIGSHNCLFVDLQRLLNEGFMTRNGDVRPANSFSTACQLIAVIFQIQSQVQYGGVASCHLDYDLAPFVQKSFAKFLKDGLRWIERGVLKEQDIAALPKRISLDDVILKESYPAAWEYAITMLEKEGLQSAQSLYHNLNTLESRAGSQIPFTSINFGTDVSMEGRLVSKWLMEASIAGIGKHYLTPIFPISIFKYKKGVNADQGDPNYDLKKLAIQSLSKRIYPNIVNCNFSQNVEADGNPDTEMATMGCVDGGEIVTYELDGHVNVESFERLWERAADIFEVKIQPDGVNHYIDTAGMRIYDTDNGFIPMYRLIRNKGGDWYRIKLSNGRIITVTSDHPFPTNRGRVKASNLLLGDTLTISSPKKFQDDIAFNTEKAWLLGLILCDGCYSSGSVFVSIAASGEDDIESAYIKAMKTHFNVTIKIVCQKRGKKGNYKDLVSVGTTVKVRDYLLGKYGGFAKKDRSIPNEVFRWSDEARIAFLAGMIDADGYVNENSHGGSIVQIGCVNKSLALQQTELIQSLGIQAKVYPNVYNKDGGIRYRVEFYPTEQIIAALVCQKKKDKFIPRTSVCKVHTQAEVASVDSVNNGSAYSYDVTTATDQFEVSGILSHNCRTMLFNDRHGLGYSRVGRGNACPVTINLPKIGLRHGIRLNERDLPDIEGFCDELDEVMRLTETALVDRFYHLCNQSVASANFMYGNGTVADFEKANWKGIYESMKHCTLAMGYIGIAEMCMAMFGMNHAQSTTANKFAIEVVKRISDFCNKASERNDLNFSCYATPAESLCKTYAMALRNEFGVVNGVTDRDYITNSHHIPVWEQVSIYKKLEIEAPFCKYPTGGCITYIELESSVMQNHKAIEDIIDYAMSLDIPYLAFNFPIDSCLKCGYQGEINYNCPRCGNTDIQRLRRVTGYLTTDYRNFNDGKIKECLDRIKHSNYTTFTSVNGGEGN